MRIKLEEWREETAEALVEIDPDAVRADGYDPDDNNALTCWLKESDEGQKVYGAIKWEVVDGTYEGPEVARRD